MHTYYIICHLTLVMFLHYLTLHKNGIVMFSSFEYCEWFCFGVSEVALQLVMWHNHSRCSKLRPFAFTHACSHVCHWLITIAFLKFVNPFLSLECEKLEIQI